MDFVKRAAIILVGVAMAFAAAWLMPKGPATEEARSRGDSPIWSEKSIAWSEVLAILPLPHPLELRWKSIR
jgi:hypothetical protein